MLRPTIFAALAVAASAAPSAGQCSLAQLFPLNGLAGDTCGSSVALDGGVALLGAPRDADAGPDAGTAIVFELGSSGWVQAQTLLASDATASARFGTGVALDGDRAAVGAPGTNGFPPSAVYVFERGASAWTQDAKIPAPAGATRFGEALALDGDRLVVGDWPGQAAYVYERGPGGWALAATLGTTDPGAGMFGLAVDVQGERALVGATSAAYVFERGPSGWSQVAKLAAGAAGNAWVSVALEGDRALAGAPDQDAPGQADAGAAFVFVRAPSAAWSLEATLFASDATAGAAFGNAVDLDGARAVVAHVEVPLFLAGAAYSFERTASGWIERAKLTNLAGPFDELGYDVAMSGDDVLLGAPAVFAGTFGNPGSATIVSLEDVVELTASVSSVSASAGGSQQLDIATCPERPNGLYIVLGSLSNGSGLTVDGVSVPLAIDSYFLHTLQSPNSPPLAGSLGLLDAAGRATATFSLPAGANPGFVGLALWHAALALEVAPVPRVAAASEAVGVSLVP